MERKADPDQWSERGSDDKGGEDYTPLDLAVKTQSPMFAHALMKLGCKLNRVSLKESTIIFSTIDDDDDVG